MSTVHSFVSWNEELDWRSICRTESAIKWSALCRQHYTSADSSIDNVELPAAQQQPKQKRQQQRQQRKLLTHPLLDRLLHALDLDLCALEGGLQSRDLCILRLPDFLDLVISPENRYELRVRIRCLEL